MGEPTFQITSEPGRATLIAPLPGPGRKRREALYSYRLVYRQPAWDAEGCLMLWNVTGGRQEYQVALERPEWGQLRWHCTCADHVYRSEKIANHHCKHIRGLQAFTPPIPVNPARRAA